MSKILVIDIGNTTISGGVFREKKAIICFKLPTHNKGKNFYKKSILKFLNKKSIKKEDFQKIIICSVVPEKTPIIKKLLFDIFKKKVLLIGKDIKIPMKNKYRNPKQVGQDRLVNAYAGLKIYGPGLIIVDFGTAITFDVVSKRGEYLGGLIFPGLDLSLDALYRRTALLPLIKIKKPKSLIGKDTISCINNGVVFGTTGVCDEIIERLQRKLRGYKVVATGGDVNFIKQFSKKIRIVRPFLTLEGLRLLG